EDLGGAGGGDLAATGHHDARHRQRNGRQDVGESYEHPPPLSAAHAVPQEPSACRPGILCQCPEPSNPSTSRPEAAKRRCRSLGWLCAPARAWRVTATSAPSTSTPPSP